MQKARNGKEKRERFGFWQSQTVGVPFVIGPAREDIIFHRAIRTLEPYQQTGARVAQQLELDGSPCGTSAFSVSRTLLLGSRIGPAQGGIWVARRLVEPRDFSERTQMPIKFGDNYTRIGPRHFYSSFKLAD